MRKTQQVTMVASAEHFILLFFAGTYKKTRDRDKVRGRSTEKS